MLNETHNTEEMENVFIIYVRNVTLIKNVWGNKHYCPTTSTWKIMFGWMISMKTKMYVHKHLDAILSTHIIVYLESIDLYSTMFVLNDCHFNN